MEPDLAFGRQLRLLRKMRDLTQEALAQQAFCAVDTVKKIERGVRRPSRQLAEQFADCLTLADDERAAFLAAARIPAPYQPVTTRRATQRNAKFPHPSAPLLGRTVELAALDTLFAGPTTQLVTLVGPGGIGKTRLAFAAGEQLLSAPRFPDGVYFVALAALDAADQIVPALAEALDLTLDLAKPPIRTLRQQVFDYLQAKRLLLILDNVEHLLDTSSTDSDDAARLVATLLDHAPEIAILATTRTRLQLRQEHLYLLDGLDIGDDLAHSSAVALFVQSARRLQPEFTLTPGHAEEVAGICRMVDGIPLAIELAAGWVDTLPPSAIAAEIARSLDLLTTELRDVPPRHRNMRAVFDSSYQQLDITAQSIFARLAILRGGGTLQALQAVTHATITQIQKLIAASLLSYDAAHGRYAVHELLRQYAAEKLAAQPSDAEETRRQHAVFYCGFVQQQRIELTGPGHQAALAALDSDRENLRAAWVWAAQRARLDLLAGAVEGLGYYFEWRGLLEDGENAFGRVAAQLDAQPVSDASLRLLTQLRAWQGNFRRLQGDIVGAKQLLQQSLALLDGAPAEQDTRVERAFVLLQLGLIASEGALDAARHHLEQSLALYQTLDRRWEASHGLLWLGDVARYQGAFAEARRHFRASLAIRSACGDRRGVAEVLIWDSHAAADSGQIEEAEALARRSHALYEELGGPANQAFGLAELAVILMYTGKYDEAHGALQQSLDLYQELGNSAMCAYVRGWLAVTSLAAGEYAVARSLSRQATAEVRALRGAESGLAFLLHYSGWVALTLGAFREAETLLQESVARHRQADSSSMVNWPLAQLGYAYWRLGKQAQAQAALYEVVRASSGQHAFVPLVLALPTVALILAEQGQSLRAVELYALAWRYPLLANAQSSIDSFGKALDAVVAALPPDLAAAAQARGQAMDLWDAAAALDAELTLLGWGADG